MTLSMLVGIVSAGAFAKGMRMSREEERADSEERISVSASSATFAVMQKAAARVQSPFVGGLPFDVLPNITLLPAFSWPLNHKNTQDGEMGYGTALPWVQEHMCPPGVQAVLVDRHKWLD